MELGFELRCAVSREHTLSPYTAPSVGKVGKEVSPFWTPGMRVVLNIFSYCAEHKGRIPISKVCRRPWASKVLPGTGVAPRPLSPGHRVALLPAGYPDGPGGGGRARGRGRRFPHEQPAPVWVSRTESPGGPGEGIAKRLGSGLPPVVILTPNTGTDPNGGRVGEFQTVIPVTDPTPHIPPRRPNSRPGNYKPHPLPIS